MSHEYVNEILKLGYDYAWESQEAEQHAKKRYKDKPISALKSTGIGGAIGSGIGALTGKLNRTGAGKAALIGGLVGALGGLAVAGIDAADIKESKKVMGMPKKQRDMYLTARERNKQIADRELNEERRYRGLRSELKQNR